MSIQVPACYLRSQSFTGWECLPHQASVQVTSLPVAWAEIVSGFTPEKMQQQGMYWLGQQRTSASAEGERVVIHALQAVWAEKRGRGQSCSARDLRIKIELCFVLSDWQGERLSRPWMR
ncbi:hypothetical protein M4951_17580 [Blastopirellula sp. J2-11]|uniref:hypothetical protein n=1 Tax=Blastopirellula sp. J2-11 TaxID=2943192 RepID=UPI0021C7EF90|nr:hypothetical protein [Blastopirellula sp. J2-11]UUO05183.1 hypothetical protein M4951_17580 [Blastopirellula sp. J2-11]